MKKLVPVAIAALLLLSACAAPPNLNTAKAALAPTNGNSASGTVTFSKQSNAVRVEGEVRGLKPNAEHGFHIHEKGDCSSGDGMSTGGHFNPTAQPHGAHSHGQHHAGDLVILDWKRSREIKDEGFSNNWYPITCFCQACQVIVSISFLNIWAVRASTPTCLALPSMKILSSC